MNTPIIDFVKKYNISDPLRLHMPGHKGKPFLGFEDKDITEVFGADSLYEADGIIKQSENNASLLFGTAATFYSTEGSSQCIRAMLELIRYYSKTKGQNPLILAGRNAHKAFTLGAALLDIDVEWVCGENISHLSCDLTAKTLKKLLCTLVRKPTAIYITSPDYLGNITNLKEISALCRANGILLAVDNAHGAYLKFVSPNSLHPIDLGADICCDSAHKTLPCLTGGAYLHISKNAPKSFTERGKKVLEIFGSTSPSYLILQSLDFVNKYISDGYKERLHKFTNALNCLKAELVDYGFRLVGNEPLKITLASKPYGYHGTDLAKILKDKDIICEFCDADYVTLMFTPEIEKSGISKLKNALLEIPRQEEINTSPPRFKQPIVGANFKETLFAPSVTIPVNKSEGEIFASASIGCPPAVPIAICGEVITKETINAFLYYGIDKVSVKL